MARSLIRFPILVVLVTSCMLLLNLLQPISAFAQTSQHADDDRTCEKLECVLYAGNRSGDRFAKIDFTFAYDSSKSEWKPNVTITTLRSGHNQFFTFDKAQIRQIGSSVNPVDFEATFHHAQCINGSVQLGPWTIGIQNGPCTDDGFWKVTFDGYIENGNPVVMLGRATPPENKDYTFFATCPGC